VGFVKRKHMDDFYTYFYDKKKERIGSLIGLIPISVGMKLQLKGFNQDFTVEKYFLKIDHPDREPGFHVFCKEKVRTGK